MVAARWSGMSDCVFCKIVAGQLGAARVWESESVLAFLDINPVAEGHTLVIPRSHAADITGMTSREVCEVAQALAKIAPAVVKAVGAQGFNLLNNCGSVAGQAVEHVHFHIIPRKAGDGRGYRWITLNYGEGVAAELAAKISGLLE